ncbi:MAG: hypothetical protein HY794_18445 [Desulfarculus sp.]|nr:hypothetical protein [Desulfarculus sp.]
MPETIKPFNLNLTQAERQELETYRKRLGFRFLSDLIRTKMLELARQSGNLPPLPGQEA